VGRETNKQRRQRQAASAREKAAASRAAQKRTDQRRRAIVILSSVVAVAVAAALIAVVAINSSKSTHQANDRTTATVAKTVTSVAPAALQTVGPGSARLSATPTKGDTPLTASGKPELLFIGGEYCPICAAERWSMVQALSRFGTFSNLSQIRSATTDGNIATFSFYKSSYNSKYLSFNPVEAEDRSQKLLERMTPAQQALFTKYGSGFPFLDFGGKYVQTTAGYDPNTLSGLDWQEIATQLKTPSSKVAQAILGESNNLTATICKLTNNQPSSACLSPEITTLQSQLGA
jgi:hypothetical protein